MDDESSSEYLSSEETPEVGSTGLENSLEGKQEASLVSNQSTFQQRQDLEWDAGCLHDVEVVNVTTERTLPLRERRNTDNWSFSDGKHSSFFCV